MPAPNDIGLHREIAGGIAAITLDRPRAMNALENDQFIALNRWLGEWAGEAAVRAVLIRGAGDRAFCAGGDIRDAYQHRGDDAFMRSVFSEEYRFNHVVSRYPKPYIALMDGLVFGGGCGASVHGSHRIVTETTQLAMPESSIGLFCDVGGGYFLSRAPGRIGEYLALTGRRIGAADAIYCGFADRFVARAKLPELVARLKAGKEIDATIAALASDPGSAPLAARRPMIDRCFSAGSVVEIRAALAAEGSDWAETILAELDRFCPFSLVVNLRHMRSGREMSLAEVLRTDYRLALRFMARDDFFEGVRALLIDKDNRPHWQPARLEDVDPAEVERCFAPLGDGELALQV